ncbi:hypothetical protein [Paguma larvata torque teno virus]|nr:hypothetical protein QKL50_gp2 [Paguma larvata torque teno virus]BBE36951.1 hypothetical protein [Paguma larvata torque teno virus]
MEVPIENYFERKGTKEVKKISYVQFTIDGSCFDSPDIHPDITFKRKEAQWKRLISQTHQSWCHCGNYLNHFCKQQPIANSSASLWSTSGEKDNVEGATGGPEDTSVAMVADLGESFAADGDFTEEEEVSG